MTDLKVTADQTRLSRATCQNHKPTYIANCLNCRTSYYMFLLKEKYTPNYVNSHLEAALVASKALNASYAVQVAHYKSKVIKYEQLIDKIYNSPGVIQELTVLTNDFDTNEEMID